MKAIVYKNYGSPDVLRYSDAAMPVPKKGQVLIKTYASSINAYDWHKLRADTFLIRAVCGIYRPKRKILGCDVAGRVVAIGKGVVQFKVGDDVYGCMADDLGEGGYAEYVCAPEKTLALMPVKSSFEQAATIPMAGVTALQGIKLGGVKEGQSVLINGASGGVGLFALQIAKSRGVVVTAVCSAQNSDLVRSLGADDVIDYKKENFWENGKQYDIIIDITARASITQFRDSLKPNGTCVVVGFKKISIGYTFKIALNGAPKAKNGNKRIVLLMANNTNSADLKEMNTLIESGNVTPIIETVYPLCETAQAFRHYETKHARGKLVIRVANQER